MRWNNYAKECTYCYSVNLMQKLMANEEMMYNITVFEHKYCKPIAKKLLKTTYLIKTNKTFTIGM